MTLSEALPGLLVVWGSITAVALHEAYKWGRLQGSLEAHAQLRRGLFRAVRDTCDDPLASGERRQGAFAVVQRAVRR